jgi:mannose-1-phosphate guanylyltransferase
MNVYAILMAGGVGARFWPRSRKKLPKQVLNIIGKKTMIQAAYDRLEGIVEPADIKVVTNAEQSQFIRERIPQLSDDNFLIEPFGRNTAPCIGLAAIHLAAKDPEAIMLVLPADHIITKVNEFQTVLRLAIEFVEKNDGLVTLGITPNEPATGYGYIQVGKEVYKKMTHAVHRVTTFAEKPNPETAMRFLESLYHFKRNERKIAGCV